MEIRIDRRTFAQALAEVAPFAPAKAPIAILKYAKVTTKGNRMKIEANDTQCSMVKYIEVMECDQDGTFLVEIAELNRFIAKTKGETIELSVNGGNVIVRHSKGTAEFQTEDVSNFPSFNMPQEVATEITLDSDILADAVTKGKGFIMNDSLKPHLCAIYAYVKDGEFGYCATDTRKLIHGHKVCEIPNRETDVHFLIMPPVFPAIVSACKFADIAKVQITDSHVQYTIGGVRIQTVQAKGNFPNFKRVIPQTWAMELAVDKSDLSDALARLSMFCDASGCVKMDVSRMDITLSADNIESMKKSTENLAHNGCDGEIQIGVNVENAISSANVFGGGEILMRMTDASRPILFAQQDNDALQVICMPMSLVNG